MFDRARRRVSRAGRPLSLTRKEMGILEDLLVADGGVVSTEDLLERVWDENADPFTRTVTVTIGRLRRKLGGLGWFMSGRVLRPVRVITATEPGGWIRLRTGSSDTAVYLEIANSGPFVPDDAVPSLFEPFRRMQARTGVRDGAGLGLSIARSVVTAHRATVTARSQSAGGLDISVVIPRCLAVEPHPPTGPQS